MNVIVSNADKHEYSLYFSFLFFHFVSHPQLEALKAKLQTMEAREQELTRSLNESQRKVLAMPSTPPAVTPSSLQVTNSFSVTQLVKVFMASTCNRQTLITLVISGGCG